jgi:hypothetical protein
MRCEIPSREFCSWTIEREKHVNLYHRDWRLEFHLKARFFARPLRRRRCLVWNRDGSFSASYSYIFISSLSFTHSANSRKKINDDKIKLANKHSDDDMKIASREKSFHFSENWEWHCEDDEHWQFHKLSATLGHNNNNANGEQKTSFQKQRFQFVEGLQN